jgi:hypothetical protein
MGGTLQYEEVIDADYGTVEYDDEGYFIGNPPFETVRKYYSIEEYLCPVCDLHLFGTKEVSAAHLPDEFTETEDRERKFEHEYENE